MQRRPSFSQFLIGTASLERPSFFYAYSGMWMHLLLSVPLLVFVFQIPLVDALTSTAISSFSLGAVIYSILSPGVRPARQRAPLCHQPRAGHRSWSRRVLFPGTVRHHRTGLRLLPAVARSTVASRGKSTTVMRAESPCGLP